MNFRNSWWITYQFSHWDFPFWSLLPIQIRVDTDVKWLLIVDVCHCIDPWSVSAREWPRYWRPKVASDDKFVSLCHCRDMLLPVTVSTSAVQCRMLEHEQIFNLYYIRGYRGPRTSTLMSGFVRGTIALAIDEPIE